MFLVARCIQVVGLLMTGYAATAAFWVEFSEASMFKWGLGGFAIFWLGTMLMKGGE